MKATRIDHGIEWGSSEMTLVFDDDKRGSVTWGLKTPKCNMQIYVTKTGKVRIHDDQGEWLPKRKLNHQTNSI